MTESTEEEINYGPLTGLIGTWQGDKGLDVAPEPDGTEKNPYYEKITYQGIGDVRNAEEQRLVILHYRQIVRRKSNDEIFHDETGYWMWDENAGLVMHSLAIPRAVCVLAGGKCGESWKQGSEVTLEVEAHVGDADWGIIQSPFMRDNAKTIEFRHKVIIGEHTLHYSETTMLEIYGRTFEHTDENQLRRC